MKHLLRCSVFACALLVATLTISATLPGFDEELSAIQQAWAAASYEIAEKEPQLAAFESLAKRAEAFAQRYPDRAEPLIWEGIVLSTYAGAKGGLGALSLAKSARERLQRAVAIDAAALDGSAYTSLGSLYYKVPGFPIGFGNDKKAREYLEKALDVNPTGIDPNYFYGEFLYEQKEPEKALEYLRKALLAPDRPGRETADAGRRDQIRELIERIESADS